MPTSRLEPNKQLTRAARDILEPAGLLQRGRSRTWLDDSGWWLCVVEFQPSSWSKGSYLNVGCCWLWIVKDYFSFDEGDRVEPFVEFQDTSQFEKAARELSTRALSEVQRYRALFPRPSAVARYYSNHQPAGYAWAFHAGVAAGLAGDAKGARKFFNHFRSVTDDREFVLRQNEDAAHLSNLVGNAREFRAEVAERVHAARKSLKLTEWRELDFDDARSA